MTTENKIQLQILNKLLQTSQEKVENLTKYSNHLKQVAQSSLLKIIYFFYLANRIIEATKFKSFY